MRDERRYEEVVSSSQGIFERFGVRPEAVTPQRLAKVIYAVMDAIHASETRIHQQVEQPPLGRLPGSTRARDLERRKGHP